MRDCFLFVQWVAASLLRRLALTGAAPSVRGRAKTKFLCAAFGL